MRNFFLINKLVIWICLICFMLLLVIAGFTHYQEARDFAAYQERMRFGPETAIEPTITEGQIMPGGRFTISGKANGFWFYSGQMHAQIKSPDGRVLWDGLTSPISSGDIGAPVSFSMQVDVGDYHGPATVVFLQSVPNDDGTPYEGEVKVGIVIK